jgi:peptide/nickel transport system substrate-binding protein
MNQTKQILALAIFTLFLFSTLGCKQDSPQEDNSLMSIRLVKDPDKLHPLISPSSIAREVYQYIFLSLADYDPNTLALSPILIEKIPTKTINEDSSIVYDIQIKPNATWSDGTPITNKDYLFTVKAIMHPLTQAAAYRQHIGKIDYIVVNENDSKNFKVLFKQDFPLSLETAINFEIYPSHIYDPNDVLSNYSLIELQDEANAEKINADSTMVAFANDFNSIKHTREIVKGSGPYELSMWNTDLNIVLKKVADYWGNKESSPFLDQGTNELIFQIIPDENTAFTQLLNDNLDVFPSLQSEQMTEIMSNELYKQKINILTPQLTKYYFLILNNKKPSLQRKNVRKALSHLLDVNQLITSFENGQAQRINAPFHPLKPYYNKALENKELSLDLAKKLLEDDGWSDTNGDGSVDKNINGKQEELKLRIHVSGQPLSEKIALLYKEAASKIGVEIDIIQKDFKLILAENIYTDDFDIVPSQASQDLSYDDPYTKWHSSMIDIKGGNDANFSNEELDELCEKIRATENFDEQLPYYKRIQEIIHEESPVVFLYSPIERIAVNSRYDATGTSKRPGYMANTFKLK